MSVVASGVDELEQRAHLVAAALGDVRVWTRTTATVAGRDYALYVHQSADGSAAHTDLGYPCPACTG